MMWLRTRTTHPLPGRPKVGRGGVQAQSAGVLLLLCALIAGLGSTSAVARADEFIWIEGEDTKEYTILAHGWYNAVRKDQLSGGAWLGHYGGGEPGAAHYTFTVAEPGTYRFFLRANPVKAAMSYRLNGQAWIAIPMNLDRAIDSINIAADGAMDMRFIGWFDVGDVELRAGRNRISFAIHGEIRHHGAIDAFVFTRDDQWTPHGTAKPGETGRPAFDAPEGTWAFDPPRDRFRQDALLDLSYLNEDVAGQHGFIAVNDTGDFIRGDGRPIRFWAVNTTTYRQGLDAVRENARFLAKRGVNMVRWHGQIQPKRPEAPLHSIDEQALNELFMLVAGMKEAGIYLTISPYYAHSINLREGDGPKLRRNWGLPRREDAPNPTGLLFFDQKLQSAYKDWMRELFTRPNPYTGIALKDEPAVAVFQIQNEDSLLFWTFSQLKGLDLDILRRQYGQWLAEEYGSLDAARQAWAGAQARGSDVDDDWDRGLISFYNLWHLFQPSENTGGAAVRMSDQARFLTETMRRWNAEVARYLRDELGVRQVINAGNWKTADPLRLNDLERYSYTANQVLAVNRYTGAMHEGRYKGWAIVAGDRFANRSITRHPRDLPVALKQTPDAPMLLPEAHWVPPNGYQAEGPFLVAAYQALNGVDAAYWFTMKQPQWRPPSSANGYLDSIGMWVIATPMVMGNFPAAALIHRQQLVRRGEPVVVEHRALDDLWRRRAPIISEEGTFDPNRDASDITDRSPVRTAVDRRAFLVGPVHVVYDSDPARTFVADLSAYLHEDVAISNTGELRWDHTAGLVTLDAPAAQGACGFLGEARRIELSDVTLTCDNEYAVIVVVALDEQPIAASRRLLVQVGTTARPNGWRQRETQTPGVYELLAHGQAPWLVEQTRAALTVNNPTLTRAIALDPNGYAAGEVTLEHRDGAVALQLPPDTLHVILTAQ